MCAWENPQAVWDTAMLGLRLGNHPKAIVTTTPRPIKLLKDLMKRDGADVRVSRATTFDNRENLPASFFSQVTRQYEGTRLGRQELEAEILEDVEGALWARELLEQTRRSKADLPNMRRIVVAIDPAISVGENSDETGIVVCGLGSDDHGYVLEDASGKFSPIEWARKAVALYHKHSADRIVAEANQGGLMVEQTVRTVDANVSFKGVHASRGKVVRAEPIAALYEQNRVHLVGSFPQLEDQLCTFEAGSTSSPDRLDAMVWALTELMVQSRSTSGFLQFYREEFGGRVSAVGPEQTVSHPVRLLAPVGSGEVQMYGGRTVWIPADRIVEMTEDEASCLVGRNGWTLLQT